MSQTKQVSTYVYHWNHSDPCSTSSPVRRWPLPPVPWLTPRGPHHRGWYLRAQSFWYLLSLLPPTLQRTLCPHLADFSMTVDPPFPLLPAVVCEPGYNFEISPVLRTMRKKCNTEEEHQITEQGSPTFGFLIPLPLLFITECFLLAG